VKANHQGKCLTVRVLRTEITLRGACVSISRLEIACNGSMERLYFDL